MKPLITKTFKYRLYPTKEQERIFNWTLGECCQLNQTLLSEKITACKKKEKQPSQFKQIKSLVQIKEQNPQLKQIFSQILQNIPKQRIPAIWQNFQQRKKNNKGIGLPKRANLPSAKPLYRYRSFTYSQHGFKIEKGQLVLSQGQGYPKLRVNIRLHAQKKRPLPKEIETCSVFLKNGRWHVCFTGEAEVQQLSKTGKKVGTDTGLNDFCVLNNGEKVAIPQFYRKLETQLNELNQAGNRKQHKRNKDDKTRPSKRYLKHKSKVGKFHEKIANKRNDFVYKLVHWFLSNYDFIAVEKLEIKKMIELRGKYQNLPKSINDAGWKIFLTFLAWKAIIVEKQVVEVNPKNTSKQCFDCKMIKEVLELKDRIFFCACGYKEDRDINAAKNILYKAQTMEPELSSLDENLTDNSLFVKTSARKLLLQIQKD